MKYVPHEYQRFATDFIVTHPTAAIFLDMGMGKSSITLTAIERLMYQEFEVRKVLIIAPLRVAKNTWPAEIQKWDHLNGLTWSVIIGTQQERMAALRREADIYLINRENTQWLIEKSGMPFDYDMVVIDELSSFKSWQSKRFRSLMKVRPFVRRIVGLTGTPSSNGLMDLFAEFRVLDMGQRLGRFIGQYRNAFFKPDRMNGPIVYSYKPLPGAEEEIYRRIGDITISMKACGHLKMPELISTTYEVEMSPDEQEQYDAMKQELVLSLPDGEVTAANAAVLTGKLLQMSNGAIYTDEGNTIQIHDRKLDALEDIIEGMNGRPLLLAYWFKHDLQRITERLTQIGVPFERLDSEASIKRWNAGQIQVGLAHPASTGHGLNLQDGGNTICWFSPIWSLELYQQTNARLFRQGQKASTVVVTHIVTKGTVDSRVLKALEEKDRIQEALIAAVKAEVKPDQRAESPPDRRTQRKTAEDERRIRMSSTKQKPTYISTQLYNNVKKMNAKEYLEQAFRLEQRINGKMMQVSALRSLAAKSTAIIRKDPVVTGGKEILMEDTIIRIVDLEREINQEIDRLVELRQEIAVMISRVENPEEQIVLEMRYLSYKKWPEIRSEMNCSKTTAFRWHQNALEEIEKIREVGTK